MGGVRRWGGGTGEVISEGSQGSLHWLLLYHDCTVLHRGGARGSYVNYSCAL